MSVKSRTEGAAEESLLLATAENSDRSESDEGISEISRRSNLRTSSRAAIRLKIVEVVKLALPHVCLLIISSIYVCFGALVITQMERPYFVQRKAIHLNQVTEQNNRLIRQLRDLKAAGGSKDAGGRLFDEHVRRLHGIHQAGGLHARDLQLLSQGTVAESLADSEWSVGSAIYFVFAALSTIGFGDMVPLTKQGQIFVMCYATIGIPLLLIATADVAKFLSAGITALYVRYLTAKERYFRWFRERILKRPSSASVEEPGDTDSMADFIWQHLEEVHEVKVHAPVVFLAIISYASLGGLVLSLLEPWSFFESFYFSFISCMKIGFGDVVPHTHWGTWATLVYSFFGLTVATMCIDVVGVHYLERLHQFGRTMGTADYLKLMQKAKLHHRRKKDMEKSYNTLVMLSKMKPSPKIVTHSLDPIKQVEPETPIEVPPPRPADVQVVDITPYSIKLAWTPPETPDKANTQYLLKFHMKHSQSQTITNIDDIFDGEYEIKGLKSFSIYEISLTAANKFGRSNSVKLIQITEPESSPQNLRAEKLTPSSVQLLWEQPFKKKRDIEQYAIYYSTDCSMPFENWRKISVAASCYSLVLEHLDEDKHYSFCISSVYDRGHSPISKAVSMVMGLSDFADKTLSRDTVHTSQHTFASSADSFAKQ